MVEALKSSSKNTRSNREWIFGLKLYGKNANKPPRLSGAAGFPSRATSIG